MDQRPLARGVLPAVGSPAHGAGAARGRRRSGDVRPACASTAAARPARRAPFGTASHARSWRPTRRCASRSSARASSRATRASSSAEGRPAQGPQGAPVLQALGPARWRAATSGRTVSGVVGETLTPELVERIGKAATLWSGAGRVLVGRDTRARAGARGGTCPRDHLGRRNRGARGCPPDTGSGVALRGPRRRRLRLPQPAGVQRREALRRRGPEAHGRGRGGDRGARRRAAPGGGGLVESREGVGAEYLRHVVERSGSSPRGFASASTAPTGLPSVPRPGRLREARRRGARDRRRPGRGQYQRGLR